MPAVAMTGNGFVWVMILALVVCCGLSRTASAAVYKCEDANGAAVYQQVPCSGQPGDGLHPVEPLPPSDPAAEARAAAENARSGHWPRRERTTTTRRTTRSTRTARDANATALRCTDADGRVSYVYSGGCPTRERRPATERRRMRETVVAERIRLETACREIRAGRGRSHVSTYDRNLGRDPCS